MGVVGRGPMAAAIAVFYIFLWASAYVPSKIASIESPPFWFLVARFAAAGIILGVLALGLRKPPPGSPRAWLVACVLGVLANALYLGLTYTAMHRLSAGMAAIVASTNPLVLGLLAPRLLGERMTWLKAAGLLLGFGGVAGIVLARAGLPSALPFDAALAFCGVLSSVASTLLFKRWGTEQSLVAINAIALLAAALVLVPVALLVSGPPHASLTPELVASFVYLVLVLSVGASLIWFWLLRHGEASRVSAYYYLTPIFGLALSAMMLHEPVGLHDLFGLAAIAGGIALVQRS
jgi:drug/metabolite transporter (DMT)-like permease